MIGLIILFVVASVVGYLLIRRIPTMLHTPLMSGMNALSGITILGAFAATSAALMLHSRLIGAIAIALATINVVAGFLVTHRMLRLFGERGGRENMP